MYLYSSINRLLRRLKILWKINLHESCVTKNERDGSRVLLIFHPQYVSQDSQLNLFDIPIFNIFLLNVKTIVLVDSFLFTIQE